MFNSFAYKNSERGEVADKNYTCKESKGQVENKVGGGGEGEGS